MGAELATFVTPQENTALYNRLAGQLTPRIRIHTYRKTSNNRPGRLFFRRGSRRGDYWRGAFIGGGGRLLFRTLESDSLT
ncbi:MAG: hypothetical protein GY820_12585 [Gammaproteobacteria bacterium]|nr:hypothetical protein [Gammaproteobacteria bacterium]